MHKSSGKAEGRPEIERRTVMTARAKSWAWCWLSLLAPAFLASTAGTAQPVHPGANLCGAPLASTNAVVPTTELPGIGPWMLDQSGTPAHWLGELYDGRKLREPINLVVIDCISTSAEAAKQRLTEAASKAGFPIRVGHSAGYHAVIAGQIYPQIPSGWDEAFSDRIFELPNNHGRIFGPHKSGGAYVFVGAFSRENVSLFRWPEHRYESFNTARDEFARRLGQLSEFRPNGYVQLENALVDDPSVSTGDHDGRAVVVRAGPLPN